MGAPHVTLDVFIQRANEIHHDKYDYSKVDWINTRISVEILCPVHGSFYQRPYKHLEGQGCPECRKNATVTQSEFIDRAKKIHGQNTYDYSRVQYVNMWTPVEIICPIHGSFWQTPAKHAKTGKHAAQGCPKCRYIRQRQTNRQRYGVANPMQYKNFAERNWESKKQNGTCQASQPEDKMYMALVDAFGEQNVVRQYSDDERYPFACDFYIKSHDIFIELNGTWFHGGHWFDKNNMEDKRQVELWEQKYVAGHPAYGQAITVWTIRDLQKRETAQKNNLNYFVFWDNNLTDFHRWLENCDYTKTNCAAKSAAN